MDVTSKAAGPAGWTRVVVGCVAGGLAGPALVVVLFSLGLPVSVAVVIVVALIGACVWHPAALARLVPFVPWRRPWLAAWLSVSTIAGARTRASPSS